MKPVPSSFKPTGIQDLLIQKLITQDEAGQLSQCTPFQQSIFLSPSGVEKLRAGRSIDFATLKTMSEGRQRVLFAMNGESEDLANLCTTRSFAVYPFGDNSRA